MKKLIILLLLNTGIVLTIHAQSWASGDNVVKIKTSAICKMCKERIERDLSLTKGVEQADLNLKDKVVSVKYNPQKTNSDQIKLAISKIGYDADELIADAKAHDRLPECCQKHVGEHGD